MNNENNSDLINFGHSTASDWKLQKSKVTSSQTEAISVSDLVVGPSGVTQVTAVYNKLLYTSDLAGVPPHAPRFHAHHKFKRKDVLNIQFNMRMNSKDKQGLDKRAREKSDYPSGYMLYLLRKDLGMPFDPERSNRNKPLMELYAKASMSMNRVGSLFNQIAEAMHKGKSCPLTRDELNSLHWLLKKIYEAHVASLRFN